MGAEGSAKLTCKLRQRGRFQLELKLHYPLRDQSRQVFQTDVYVFVPDKLDLTADSYGVRRVLGEIVLLLRHSSPRIPLEELLRPASSLSPLARLEAISVAGLAADQTARVVHELKTLVNAYRAESRSTVVDARHAVSREAASHAQRSSLETSREGAAAAAEVEAATSLIVALPAAFRALRGRLERPSPPLAREVAQALEWADEALHVIAVGALFRLLDAIRGHRALRSSASRVREALFAETEERSRKGMPFGLRPGRTLEDREHNQAVLLRIRALKRWSQSALYLAKRVRKENARVGQIAAATAAALAMSFAVIATAFAQELFAAYSLPWAFVIVFSYILKDRIKEAVRTVIGAMIPRLLSDRSHTLVDRSGGPAGIARETVQFARPERTPAEVQELRNRACAPVEDLPGEPETGESVLHYRKWMRTRSALLLHGHERLDRLTALVRWGVEGWLEEMDEAYSVLRSMEAGREVRVLGRRVYHVHLVVRVREEAKQPRSFLYRIALSREGIARAERLDPEEALTP